MPDNGAAGTTVSFGGTQITEVRSVSVSIAGNEVDVTALDDALHTYVMGIKDVEVTVETVGKAANTGGDIAEGDTGALSVAFNDGTTETGGGGTFVCTAREISGEVDGEIVESLTFKPHGG